MTIPAPYSLGGSGWTRELPVDPLPSLLTSSNQALQFFVARDLLGQNPGPIQDLWTIPGALKILRRQQEDGSWPVKAWVQSSGGESDDYATAFTTLTLSVPDGRLSIFNRDRPKLED